MASYFTLAGDLIPFASDAPARFDLKARADAAARAGFVGIGLETNDLTHNVDQYGYAGMRRILSDAGLSYVELEVLTDWFADGDRRAVSDKTRQLMLQAAQELGVAKIKTIGDADGGMDFSIIREPWPMTRLVEEYGRLAREAAKAGSLITLELVPGTGVSDLATAQALAEGANEPNAGLLIDIWHLNRSGIPYEDVQRLPPGLINAVEVDDAMARMVGTVFEDTINNRKLPGEGELDVIRFLQCIASTGYNGVYGVEMVSEAHRKLSLEQAATRSFSTTMEQFAAASLPSA
ncbi:sugar phosphate isomerase/epimerase [Sphingobium phenoxybenzoativorans]|uniref:Sugar phosphate isomerase/epimerase n=1 Tax=Sphingobium phenoxybenzoativorans TaxID=1592790 RepID=A0A975K9H4_9SPHN|nr:sugar phosphate isomerase/epimerase [Sphingobium phenoxybenzoativorans]QUT06829.1 sugar phosphate isomerase/epimerase [Sphingobium phenoxybenzoativorans]